MIAPDPSSLMAVCLPLGTAGAEPDLDPLTIAGDDGYLFVGPDRMVAGQGTAATLSLPRGLEDPGDLRAVHGWLASVPIRRLPAAGNGGRLPAAPVVALGALPFDRTAGATLAVPARTYCRDAAGAQWVVAVVACRDGGPGTDDEVPVDVDGDLGGLTEWLARCREASAAAAGQAAGGSAGLAAADAAVAGMRFLPPGEDYAAAVAEAVGDIRAGRLHKVVLARAVELRFRPGGVPAPAGLVRRLWGADPAFHAFSLPVAGGRFVGASPELIVARHGADVTSLPLAGTVALPGGDDRAADAAVARLLASGKDLAEHRLVVEAVAAGLSRRCTGVTFPPDPVVVRLRSDARLGTPVRAHVPAEPSGEGGAVDGASSQVEGCSALELLAALHPTPAVGGVERAAALARIEALEAAPRGYWAGPVGWVDGTGDGEWVLAIRSTVLADGVALVHAGAGIVAGSDPEAELAETTVKLAPVLEALAPEAAVLPAPGSPATGAPAMDQRTPPPVP